MRDLNSNNKQTMMVITKFLVGTFNSIIIVHWLVMINNLKPTYTDHLKYFNQPDRFITQSQKNVNRMKTFLTLKFVFEFVIILIWSEVGCCCSKG